MWNTIGERNDCLKIDNFWKGPWKDFQCDLWKDKLNLKVLSLKEVMVTAEVIKISRSVMIGFRKSKPSKCQDGTVIRSVAMAPEAMGETHNKGFGRRQRGQ